jgi:hypothetical protein
MHLLKIPLSKLLLALLLFCQPVQVIRDIDQNNAWQTCGACGNTGGTGSAAALSAVVEKSAIYEDGVGTRFSVAAKAPFSNGYWYQVHPAVTSQVTSLIYEFDFLVSLGDENAPQAIEFECQQTIGGYVYNFAWQADYATGSTIGKWRAFDYGLKRWDETGLTFSHFAPGTWHHIMAEFRADGATHTVYHDALTVDGLRSELTVQHTAPFTGAKFNQFTNAFQLDSNFKAAPYSVYVDRMRISIGSE